MHGSSLKSQVIENSNPSMLYSKEIGGAKTPDPDPEPIGDWSINAEDDDAQTCLAPRPLKPIVIVEPRLRRAAETTNLTSSNSDWFMLPTTVDFTNDMMRLVSSLSSVVQILTRMTNAAAQELRLHPEREEGFQGLRTLLNYADQMYTTLLQTFSMSRPESQRNQPAAQSHSLFHHLFEPIRNAGSRGEAPSTSPSPLAERSRSSRRRRPYRVVAVTASEASLEFDADADPNGNGL
ncbi:uncharacterized protein LOC132798214 isoform X2 [Drosophila nasuta]|uniref:uncharacterized protein LOC132798214 isoform X2 n=1 Tax=Drosophila nasuta TaxID=42062 RepID=UPI00295F3871|nr:uncharacterized protein LOC132798214 isoform X2 [Drosophila nasuta]